MARPRWFVVSNRPVNFTEFARFFRDGLGSPQALYFDGSISRLYAPGIGRDDIGFPMGPIVGTVVPSDSRFPGRATRPGAGRGLAPPIPSHRSTLSLAANPH